MGNNRMEEVALGGLSGAAISALAWWDRLDRRTQQRLIVANDTAVTALSKITSLVTSADFVRLYLPIVRDAIVGTALASSQLTNPKPVPTLPAPPSRPVLGQENAVGDLTWPPKPGTFDDNGNVETIGELSTTFLALTYQEVRAALQGLTQHDPLSADGLRQVFRAFNQLVKVLGSLGLSAAQYGTAWQRLFSSGSGAADPHTDPTKVPSFQILDPGVAAVQSLFPLNTDAAHRYRIVAGGAGIGSGVPIVRVIFATPYRYVDQMSVPQPLSPVVVINNNSPTLYITNITSTSYDVVTGAVFNANQTRDFYAAAIAGMGAV